MKSIELSKIIFMIGKGVNYPQNISKELKKAPTTIITQLSKLEKEKYVLRKDKLNPKEKLKNKTIYLVNYEMIIIDFFNYLKSKNNKLNIEQSYYSNQYLIKFFKELIKISKINTLEELFEKIRNISPYDSFIDESEYTTPKQKEFIDILFLIEESNLDHEFIDKIVKILSDITH
jgi:hypothetical protein